MLELGDLGITEVTLTMLKEYLAKQADRLKPSNPGHRIRFVGSLFRYAYEETYLTSNPYLKLREPKLDKRIPKFLIEEDDEFFEGYRIHLSDIGINAKTVKEVNVENWINSGNSNLIKDNQTIIMSEEGNFYELVRNN
ncbi:hypothetical protein [Paenibacillus methanolicus]|uniref:hypothetical protein n=1 Tax=Paenibacillus methanolicus TaxID=582686 RepID=UPI001FE9131B|nr:hypothetical protein [Paenibacillus methanolicus]